VHDVALRLAERVRQLRQKCDLTQASLASRAGVTVETVARLSAALGVDICDLLASKAPPRQRDDRLGLLLRRASPATAQRIYRVAEVLLSDDNTSENETRRTGKRTRR
jgi:transcriptional regulator with XRE-family HTH domain